MQLWFERINAIFAGLMQAAKIKDELTVEIIDSFIRSDYNFNTSYLIQLDHFMKTLIMARTFSLHFDSYRGSPEFWQ